MAASRHLFLLGVGLCLVVSHSLSAEVKVYGGNPKNQYEDVTWQLEKQRTNKRELETLLEKTTDETKKSRILKDIDKITSAIAKMEVTFRVVYKDHIAAIKDKTQNLEDEKAKLEKALEAAEQDRVKAVADMQVAKEKEIEQIGAYEAKLEESTNEMEKLKRDYATLKELQTQQLEKEKREKEQLLKVRDELTMKLQQAETLHAKALEAFSASSSRGFEKPSLPHENEIIAVRNRATALRNTPDKRKRLAGLTKLQATLKDLYMTLYKESNLPGDVPHQELENKLSLMKMNAKNTRSKHINRKTALVDQIRQKKLTDSTGMEIEALQNVNKQVNKVDTLLREIAQRKAFLRSIKEVALLTKEATDAAKYAK